MAIFDQAENAIRCEWGQAGVEALAPISDVVIIVDVLSFSTCVDIATARGASILPFSRKDDSAHQYAGEQNALLASPRRTAGREVGQTSGTPVYSLSPASLLTITSGTRLVLPSPNGATLSGKTGATPTLAGCLRNAQAVARAATSFGTRIAVIPAGERWPDGTLRPAIEDWLGAGAIIHALAGERSPEAELAAAAFQHAHMGGHLATLIERASSGKELIAEGFADDVRLACELNISDAVPHLHNGAYENHATS